MLFRSGADNETVEILKNVSNMAQLMRNCDLAVTAAGTMLTECAASTLPVIYYQVADNQKYNVEFWQKTGGMVFAGDVSGSEADRIQTLNNITDQIQVLIEDSGRLGTMKRMLTGLTDGRGAVRIAKALLTK